MPFSLRVLTTTLFPLLLVAAAAAQEPARRAADRIEPVLFADAERLAAEGVLREKHLVLPALRVVVELERAPGDAVFEVAGNARLEDVQASVIERQGVFVDRLDAALTAEQRARVRVLYPLELQFMLALEVDDAAALRALANVPGVQFVWKDNVNELHTTQGRTITGSAAQAGVGWTGAGVGVAVIDSRFDLTHTELGGSTTLPNSVVKGGQNFSNPGSSIHSTSFNSCYHGTACMSIVRRYAPGTHLYGLVVFPNSFDSVIANAINWCVVNKNGTGGGAPIRVLTMSLGGGMHTSPVTSGTLHSACTTALANDILCCASAGNDGWTNAMGSPAASTNCISIGSTWDANGAPYTPVAPANCTDPTRQVDERACYSDTASFLSFYCPSEQVICAQCGGGTFEFGGTSAASPAGAGLIAQLVHALPGYIGDMTGIVNAVQSTGVTVIGDPTKRRFDLTAVINPTTPHNLHFASFTTSGVGQQPGATMTLTPTVTNDGPQATGAFAVEFFLSSTSTWTANDIYLGQAAVASLAVGQSLALPTVVDLPWRLQPQAWYVHAVADRLDVVPEWDENDNSTFQVAIVVSVPCVTKIEWNDPLLPAAGNAEVSVTAGGTVHPLVVVPCVDPLTTLYVIAWGGSGTTPGVPLSPSAHLPLNPDFFTDLSLNALNGPVLQNFLGVFTPQGLGQATFALPPSTGLPGTQTHLAAILIGQTELFAGASNALGLLLTP